MGVASKPALQAGIYDTLPTPGSGTQCHKQLGGFQQAAGRLQPFPPQEVLRGALRGGGRQDCWPRAQAEGQLLGCSEEHSGRSASSQLDLPCAPEA